MKAIEEIPPPNDPPARIRARRIIKSMLDEMTRQSQLHQELFTYLWGAGDCTAQEIFDELGEMGVNVMKAAGINVISINAKAECFGKTLADYLPEQSYVPPVEYTENPDGTITLKQ